MYLVTGRRERTEQPLQIKFRPADGVELAANQSELHVVAVTV